jgi:regulator of PEP synthase PpsR (kinase-PPPase family)
MYLGYLGYKTANVPIVKGIEPPKELFTLESAKIVGLTIGADRLADIRRERARLLRGARQSYAGIVEIYDELDEATAVHRRLGCPVIDVTELSVEETAQRVIRLVETRRNDRQAS